MSEIMLTVLRMPADCWSDDPFYQAQRHAWYIEAADEIERLREENKRLTLEVAALRSGEFICKKCGLRTDAEKSREVEF